MRVRWTKRAKSQLLELSAHVAQERPMTAKRLVRRLRRATGAIGENPLAGRMIPEFRDPSLRERLCTPYRILYSVHSDVFILAIYDGRRLLPDDPEDL